MKMNEMMNVMQNNTALWVFAYGSLLWKPCYQFHRKVFGHIKGQKRRFYQGNTNVRGSVSQPGRVAILVPDEEEVTWGVAYEIRGQQHVRHALENLYVRENSNGGYHTMLTTFYPRPHPHPHPHPDVTEPHSDVITEPFAVMCFTATPASHLYMGPDDVTTMARQVVAAKGEAGTNAEYVLRTAEYVREHIPEDEDQHLFGLERTIRKLLLLSAASAGVGTHHQNHHHHHKHHVPLRRGSSLPWEVPSTPVLQTVHVPV